MIKKFSYIIITKIIFIFIIIFLYLIKKIILVRFGELETRNIGHYSCCIDTYLHEKDLGIIPKKSRTYDIWIKNKTVANNVLLIKWKKHLNVYPHHFLFIWKYLNKYNFGKEFLIPFRHWSHFSDKWPNVGNAYRDVNNVLKRTNPHINFTSEEVDTGERFFIDNNIRKKPILFFARDTAYRNDASTSSYRVSSIEDQKKAVEAMCENNYCIRVGSLANEKLKINNKNFIDYTFSKYRNELNDLYIMSKCKFLVSTGSGFDQLALLFRKPIVYVNATETEYRINPLFNDLFKLFIPKKIFSKKKNRILTFSEVFKIGCENLQNDYDYKKLELSLIDNTPEEILDVVVEMEQRLTDKWINNTKDEELQKKYWEINSFEDMPKFKCKIGSKFLRDNTKLLV